MKGKEEENEKRGESYVLHTDFLKEESDIRRGKKNGFCLSSSAMNNGIVNASPRRKEKPSRCSRISRDPGKQGREITE